jgi:hypothetical protein
MATLPTLVDSGIITSIEVELDGSVLAWRELYGFPAVGQPNFFVPWLRDTLPGMRSQVGAQDTPEEQVYGLLELFVSGEPMIFGEMFKPLHPNKEGVWEFRTLDVRIFGWFYKRDRFLAVFGDDATRIHAHGLHTGYVNEVIRLRKALALDPPKFIPGVDPNVVLSLRP